MIRSSPSIPIPRTVPVLPLHDKVLLPGVVTRLQISRRESIPLFEKILRTYDSKELSKCIIAVFPVRGSPSTSPSASSPSSSPAFTSTSSSSEDDGSAVSKAVIKRRQGVTNNRSQGPGDDEDSIVIGSSAGQVVPMRPGSGNSSSFALTPAHLFGIGCAARLVRLERAVGGFTVVLEGIVRLRLNKIIAHTPFFEADVSPMPDKAVDKNDQDLQDHIVALRSTSKEFVSLLQTLKLPAPVLTQLQKFLENVGLIPGQVVDLLISTIESTLEEKIMILDAVDLKERIPKAVELLTRQIHVLKISQKVHDNVEGKLNKKQREFYLRQQMAAIKEELGEKDAGEEDEMTTIENRLNAANLPAEVQKAADREMKRLRKMQPASSEYSVIRNYLDWLGDLPWTKSSEDILDVEKARKQLNDDHHGLEKVKRRILEYLAVTKLQQMKGDVKGPILCLVGPPGVGKTSLGRSIATAMGRKFHRISLGGVWDESEIRGHRRTYVGALPGLIIHGLKKCEVNNPVFLLDEIDKVGSRGHHGDPSAAFLEVLDPEQNNTFTDHYLNVPFDLSKILFIATANSVDTIPAPLLDRMELITIPGYTYAEKLAIATNHLLPKQIRQHGLSEDDVKVTQPALLKVATGYTRESGVRHLEREIGSLVRAKAVEFAEAQERKLSNVPVMEHAGKEHKEYQPLVTLEDVEEILGQEKYVNEVTERTPTPGVVTGMAYNGVGGGILFIEVSQMPGKGLLQLTGSLGDVIKESAQIALSWVKSHGYEIGLTNSRGQNIMEKADVHIHMPSGGTPKDGPSAGIAMVCALVSMFSNQTVPATTAMTGEFTLRGLVMPVGGIKEKVIAAHRAGVRKIIMPLRNQKDVTADVPANVREEIEFFYASTVWEVLREAFEGRVVVRTGLAGAAAGALDSRM
ncbi:ATP-dependent Lon protease [Entomortierella parvispora]|uniref:Lon protease homolog n=1 Tax=Entomortierella parvispora TaxID=205924 RepID=A0A9P3HB54_9FUNG|nr:ATP-dependent Lon protease [Entomortierella parvispora]